MVKKAVKYKWRTINYLNFNGRMLNLKNLNKFKFLMF